MERGKHIVLEGPDASGKKTQSELLVGRLNQEKGYIASGKEAVRLAFPDYEAPFGRLVREYLNGDSPSDDPAYASILYAADRYDKKDFINSNLEKGNWIVCDRYTESTLAHQGARAGEGAEKLSQWVLHTEYELLGVPKADLTILLNVSYEICYAKAAARRPEQGVTKDRHEDDDQHLRLAWERYQKMAKDFGWPVIDCSPQGELLSREEIHEKIWQVVKEKFV